MSRVYSLIKKLVYPETYSQEAYITALRDKYHVDIGHDCRIYSPNQTFIDKQRGHMLHIGNHVIITRNVTILTHDYSRAVCCNIAGQYGNVGEAAYTFIGDNVFIGVNATILMGTHIGNNSIVGAGAVVSGIFPDNCVIAGNPAKVVCSLDEYYKRRKNKEVESAKEYVRYWRKTYGKDPTIYDMTNAFAWLYIPHNKESIDKYPELFDLSAVDKEVLLSNFLLSKPLWQSFEDFLADC